MSLKALLNKQSIMIDDHKWGAGEIKNWDNMDIDVHIDKKTQYKIEGKIQEVRIRIPINSKRKLHIESKSKILDAVPRKLEKEINKAFNNKSIRQSFIRDLVSILENYSSNFNTLKQVEDAIKRIIEHFDLKWTDDKIVTEIADVIDEVEVICEDENNERYYISMNDKRILIGDIDDKLRNKLLMKGFNL